MNKFVSILKKIGRRNLLNPVLEQKIAVNSMSEPYVKFSR
jgi:hypothetical protein